MEKDNKKRVEFSSFNNSPRLCMAFTKASVLHVAHLARLHLADDETEALIQSLENIKQMMDRIAAAPTDDVQPMASPHDSWQPLRKDEVTEQDERETLLANAPASEDNLFLVPRVIE
jgi:aspartyl-tRNA(Asn)/glutamyl-tRNA(Gln) amidotransferase subunit C